MYTLVKKSMYNGGKKIIHQQIYTSVYVSIREIFVHMWKDVYWLC